MSSVLTAYAQHMDKEEKIVASEVNADQPVQLAVFSVALSGSNSLCLCTFLFLCGIIF